MASLIETVIAIGAGTIITASAMPVYTAVIDDVKTKTYAIQQAGFDRYNQYADILGLEHQYAPTDNLENIADQPTIDLGGVNNG